MSSAARRPSPAAPLVSLSITKGPHLGVTRLAIRRRIDAMIALLQLQKNEISFVLTDNERIHALNKNYRQIDRPTDVLAFAIREGDFAELAGAALGDVIVSVDAARKQARERGVSVLEEVTMLLAHGLLHLLGWDHDTARKDRLMRAETDRLCQAARPSDLIRPPKERAPVRAAPGARRSKAGAKRDLSRKRSTLKR